MNFEWDEDKRLAVLEKHGVDFRRIAIEMSKKPFAGYRSDQKDEERYVGFVEIEGSFWAAIYTIRGEALRLISARKWKTKDEAKLREIFDRGAKPSSG